jgi:hypothetical protein
LLSQPQHQLLAPAHLESLLCRGVDIKKTLHDFVNYSNADFYSCLPQKAAKTSTPTATIQAPAAAAAAAAAAAPSSAATAASPAAAVGSGFDVPDSVPFREAPCPNYARCLHAWDRQAAYIPWALQVRLGWVLM